MIVQGVDWVREVHRHTSITKAGTNWVVFRSGGAGEGEGEGWCVQEQRQRAGSQPGGAAAVAGGGRPQRPGAGHRHLHQRQAAQHRVQQGATTQLPSLLQRL